MKIAVLGASGKCGHQVVRQALSRGHQVVAVIRDPGRLDVQRHSRMRVEQADGITEEALASTFRRCDAVVNCLGIVDWPWATITFFSDTIRTIADAMNSVRVTRLICISSIGVRESPDDTWAIKLFWRPVFGRHFDDLRRMEDFLKAECPHLEYTVVKSPNLSEKPIDARPILQHPGEIVPKGSSSLPRANLASFMLDCLEKRLHLNEMIAVALPE